jgi:hypothetical protein
MSYIYNKMKEGWLDCSHLAWQLPSENTLLKENIEGTERRERRRKQLLYDVKETKGYRKLRQQASSHCVERSPWTRLWSCRIGGSTE